MDYLSINGCHDLTLSVTDRAFNYGDGLFTTAKICQGEIELLSAHLERLKKGCKRLLIEGVDFDNVEKHLVDVAKSYSLAVIKVVISAGNGGRGYSRAGVCEPNVIVTVHEFPKQYLTSQHQGFSIGVANTVLGVNPQLAGIKHLNRLEQVLVRKELDNRPEDDLLVLNVHQYVVESSSANVFYQVNEQWYTPDLSISGVNGIMRQHILSLLPDVIISQDNLSALGGVTAMFICNCVFGVIPVTQFNQTSLDITPVLKVKALLL